MQLEVKICMGTNQINYQNSKINWHIHSEVMLDNRGPDNRGSTLCTMHDVGVGLLWTQVTQSCVRLRIIPSRL